MAARRQANTRASPLAKNLGASYASFVMRRHLAPGLGALASVLLSCAALIAVPYARSAEPPVEFTVEVTDPIRRPLADAVVYLEEPPSRAAKPRRAPYVMDQVGMELVPRVLPVPVGSKVVFPNKDSIHHSLYSFSPVKTFEIDLYKDKKAPEVVFESTGAVQLGCNIHDWMGGTVLVLPNAHFAVTDKTGKAVLRLPARRLPFKLAVYHDRLRGGTEKTTRLVEPSAAAKPLIWRLSLDDDRRKKKPSALDAGYR